MPPFQTCLPMPQALFAVATNNDVPALSQLVNGAYRGESSRRGWTTEADLLGGIRTDEEGLREMMANPAAQILLYIEAEQCLGCVYVEKRANSLYLGMLTVSPTYQDKGIGRTLLEAAEAHGRDLNCQTVRMTVIPQRTELVAWYERRGYRPTGETHPFPADDPRFGLPKMPLSFIVLEKIL